MINTYNETSLHETLKHSYCDHGGAVEVPLDGVICDVIRSDGKIVEVQTSGFGQIKKKLENLLLVNKIELVHPIAVNLIIETYSADRTLISRRKSPKHGNVFQLFNELTGIYTLLSHPNLTVTGVFTDVSETRIQDGTGSWRRKGVRIENRKLITIHEKRSFSGLDDFKALIPDTLPSPFTVSDLKKAGAGKHAGKMAWVLRKCGCIIHTGKRGNAFLYEVSPDK
ncbi:MAG TPA: hypothetical protein GXZ47_04595 [Treponema sp.]|nr:hypothetical protein [Treponema sp.]